MNPQHRLAEHRADRYLQLLCGCMTMRSFPHMHILSIL